MKTHVVIDLMYTEDEGNETFVGSLQDCHDFVEQQGGMTFSYQVLPLLENEYKFHNSLD